MKDTGTKIIASITAFTLIACQSHSQPSEIGPNNSSIQFEEVAGGLNNPWGMAFLPNGDILVTEKEGEIRIIRDGELLDNKVQGVPEIYVRGQGGLMDIELHPEFENNHWLYLSYGSEEGKGSGGNTTIARFTYENETLTDKKVLYKAEPNTTHGNHWGSRLAFDAEGYLYFTIGDRGSRQQEYCGQQEERRGAVGSGHRG